MSTRMERRWKRQTKKRRSALRFAAELLAVIVLAGLVRAFVFSITEVDGPSMQDTLYSGQIVAVEKLTCRFGGVQRGQIVICRYPSSHDYYIKRVIALEGDTLEIRDGMTYLNGQALQEEYVTHPAQEDFGSVTVEPGHVFVLGDNRANSHDSRTEGTLAESSIVGRAVCVLFPFDQIKTLNAPQE